VIIGEASSMTPLESLIMWNWDTPLILAGNTNQLPPLVMLALQEFANKKPVHAFLPIATAAAFAYLGGE
jgi:hypothetical protein